MRTEGVAYIAALSSTLGLGSRVYGFYDPAYGWSRQEILTARLIDEFRMFEWGLGGKKSIQPELVTPQPKDSNTSGTADAKHIGIAVPISVIDKLFLQGGDD